jgi:cellulose synthase/poly-beta-1,6-N-acetylglucosamine synthase-like glycosyltransferase
MTDLINILALFVWGSFTSFVLLGIIAQFNKVERATRRERKHRFVIVSVASNGVKNALLECIEHTRAMFPASKIQILIDEGADLQQYLQDTYKNVVVVPKEYRHDIVAKGRAINYFIEEEVAPDFWYSFIDDDNLVSDKKFLYEIPVMDSKGYVATNPILKPREGRSKLAYIMDSIRYFDDMTVFRFFTGVVGRPLLGLHGELLTVKGSVLKEVGFARHSLTEDFRFAIELVKLGYKVWQSDTIVSIKSPNTIKDLLKQRGRWFKGLAMDIKHAPFIMRLLVGWRISVWGLGIFGSWAFSFLWFDFSYNSILLAPGGLYYWFVYLWGIRKLGDWRYLPALPLLGIIESSSFAFGLRQKTFVVINKN